MPAKKSKPKPKSQTRNTFRLQFSLYPDDREVLDFYITTLPAAQRNQSAALRTLLLAEMDRRFRAGKSIPKCLREAIVELS